MSIEAPAERPSAGAAEVVRVALAERSYDIRIAPGLIARAGHEMAPLLDSRRVFVVTDENVARLYLEPFIGALKEAGLEPAAVVLPAGEPSKDFAHLERLCDDLLGRDIERTTTVAALGGGVVGDLAGFAASIVLRGVPYVQVPTTLLAQVDSSVGGKTGINTPRGKNLVGSFYQPRLVLTDTGTLDTLARRELLAGYAEVVKYALIDDAPFFDWLEDNAADALAGAPEARRHMIATCCRAKARIVGADEREQGERTLLNLGHTVAHALEAETGFGPGLLHGEAVAIGLVLAFALSARLGLCADDAAARVAAHAERVGLPASPAAAGIDTSPARLMAHMRHDKKVREGRLRLVLARGVGKAFVADDIPEAAFREALAASLRALPDARARHGG